MKVNGRDRGATLPIVALLLPVLIIMTSFAVDLGRQRSSRRTMQARADVIALDLVRLTGSASWDGIIGDAGYATYWHDSAARNDIDPSKLAIVWGTWSEAAGFQACTILANCTGDGTIPTAVKVTAAESTEYFFQPGSGNATRSAIAATDAVAGFQVGTRLLSVSVEQSVILNGIFSAALGGPVNLTAVGYGGLLGATLPLGPLATALTFGSPDEMADATVGAQTFYLAAAQVMQNQGNTAAATALGAIATQTNSSLTFDMGQLMEIEQGGADAAANGSVDLYSFITGSVFVIDGTHTVSIPTATLGIAGAASTVNLTLIERPRVKYGREGASVSTQQASIGITTTITNKSIAIPGLTNATVSGTVPLSMGLVGGTGTLTDIDCGLPGISVGLTPQPVTITGSANLEVRANLIILGNVPVATAIISNTDISGVAVSGTSSGASFAYPNEFMPTVGTGTMKSAPTNTLSLGGSMSFSAGQVTLLNAVSVGSGVIATALNDLVLTPVLNAVNSTIISAQLDLLLGIDIGGADIGALDMECESVKLVG